MPMSLSLSGNGMTETTAAERAIRRRIRQRGRITFAEFMQTALYHPVDGYYTSVKPFGAAGDYYTSPAVHPAFGALLAVQLYGMWRCLGKPSDFTVVEMGAGNGMLARDIISFAIQLPDRFAESLTYICVDRYAPHQAAETSDSVDSRLEWLRADALPIRGVVGCFISNELVDAFPVHRFQIADGKVKEIYVSLDGDGEFVEVSDKLSIPSIEERLGELGFPMIDGHKGEVNLQIKPWLIGVAQAISKGFVLTIDYGYEATELYSARRRFGTLQTYYRHTEGGSPYQRIGRQDLTAHVDFSLLQSAGQAVGLNTLVYQTQSELLCQLGIYEMREGFRSGSMNRYERNANMMALRELLKPDGLGGFKALIQEKATGVVDAEDLLPSRDLRQDLKMPFLSGRHMSLMEGRYPHTSWEAPSLWGEWRPSAC
jgi:SAM-dependent MidA family methyltransferase